MKGKTPQISVITLYLITCYVTFLVIGFLNSFFYHNLPFVAALGRSFSSTWDELLIIFVIGLFVYRKRK